MNSTLDKSGTRPSRTTAPKSPKSRTRKPLARNIDYFLFAVLMTGMATLGIGAGLILQTASTEHPGQTGLSAAKTQAADAEKPVAVPMRGVWSNDPVDLSNPQAPVSVKKCRANGVSLIIISGGVASSRRAVTRHGVSDFVRETGAAAGLNGTFFANASLNGTDNLLIGPSLCGDEAQAVVGPFDKRPALKGRPLVLMSPTHTKIVPYDPAAMDNDFQMRYQMPEVSDAFLGGVWLVHDGAAVDDKRLASFHVKDANDFRRRAFFALLPDGRPALGATDCSVSSRELARALATAKIREAVLLDSGFSTSLVFGNQVLVSGHSTRSIPSRPVPHAILLFGNTTTAQTPVAPLGSSGALKS
ncbi:MAG: phosphodiester glycosidase family protein [Capsulimonadaceae bacterium]|nr:phosphodiester glycosidase family protein [Capsulimonadaceae bacterium]